MNSYDRKLARSVYLMVLLAILAMVLAEGSVVYFALACLAALISWPIAHGRNRQTPVPRWLISLAVLVALLFFFFELASGTHLVKSLAHFMIFVQVCKFFESKRARDYGQLIVLSMLEIVVAAILSSSLAFGVLLTIYLALCIYTLLLFHFKREMELFEAARGRGCNPAPGALAQAADTLNAINNWRFWRISASTASFAIVVGVLLFLGFPRVGEGLFGRIGPSTARHLTGFSPETTLGQMGSIKESDELVMWVEVRENGQPVSTAEPLMLRGVVQDHYEVEDGEGRWQSEYRFRREHGESRPRYAPSSFDVSPDSVRALQGQEYPDESNIRELRIALKPIGTQYLFSTYPPLRISSETPMRGIHVPYGQTLRVNATPRETIRYSVWVPRDPDSVRIPSDAETMPPESPANDRIADLARQWTENARSDADKVRAIESRLLTEFSYTLQMQSEEGVDPLETFLFRTRKGHCEYFASAMTVMCQRLAISARLVNGFKAVEYNPQGGYYIVRQKHAHSWVEVYLNGRWRTFDPTPARGDDSFDTPSGLLGWLTHSLDFLNYQWQQRVLNYSRSDRDSLMGQAENTVGNAMHSVRGWATALGEFLESIFVPDEGSWLDYALPWLVLAGAIGLIVLILKPLRRRLGLGLSWSRNRRQERMLRDRGLGFWADLLRMLDRHRLTPAAALTPLEVTADLQHRIADAPPLRDLAVSYYKVRYGPGSLSDGEQSRVQRTIELLAVALRDGSARKRRS